MVKDIYGMKIKNEQDRMESQSGGAFYCMAKNVIHSGGVVYGVILNKKMVVEYKRGTTIEDVRLMKGSKYVQADIGDSFEKVLEDLEKGKRVFFSGTPCCVSGLLAALKQRKIDITNLVTCDIVCHGVGSPLIFREFIHYINKGSINNIEHFKFRDKCKGWHSHIATYCLNGKEKSTDIYAKFYASGNCMRESCHKCKYANYNRNSDITIGDFWGIEKYHPEVDDNKGISLLMVNSKKGAEIFKNIRNEIEFFESNEKEVSQPQLNYPFSKVDTYDEFWKDYHNHKFKYIVFKYGRGGYKGIIKNYVKEMTQRVGVYKIIHSILRKTSS